jgi:hypothetical protein
VSQGRQCPFGFFCGEGDELPGALGICVWLNNYQLFQYTQFKGVNYNFYTTFYNLLQKMLRDLFAGVNTFYAFFAQST